MGSFLEDLITFRDITTKVSSMASSFVLAPLSAPHDIPNMMLLLVVNDELKTRIQAIRQTLVLHDAISASIEFTGVFVKADGPLFHQENVMEELIAWFSEHNVPTKSGVLTVLPYGIRATAIPLGQKDNTPMESVLIPYTFLDSEKPVISLLANQDIRSNQSALLQ